MTRARAPRQAKYFIAGILKHTPALQALTCPTVCSYNRHTDWSWSPTSACWAFDNRTSALRVKVRYSVTSDQRHDLS